MTRPNKYAMKGLPPLTAEPMRCVRCMRQNATLMNLGPDEKGRTQYGCTDCMRTRRAVTYKRGTK